MIKLRPFQEAAVGKVNGLLAAGVRAVLLVAPTGAGKTVMGAEFIRQRPDKRILFLAPRRELIYQTCRKLHDVGVFHDVILAGHRGSSAYYPVKVASVDTLVSRVIRREKLKLDPFDLIIVDEAHVGLTETRQRLLELWPEAQIIGLTATPTRSDGKALGVIYDELVEAASVAELTDQGFLVPGRYFSVSDPDLRGVRTVAGDYNRGDLDKAMNKPKLVGDIVQHWLEHASTRRTVVFASSIGHSAALAAEFVSHGVTAEHVDANTPTGEREAIFARFSSGATQVLTNCTLASIGFDLPDLDCVVFARPTKSLGLFIQMLGRGLRPAPGKQDCLVLDHAGVVQRFGFATEPRFWTLHGKYAQDLEKLERAKREKEEKGLAEITCPECRYVFTASGQCPACGYVFPRKQKPVDTVEGRLVELTPKKRERTEIERMEFYLQLAGYAQIKGYSMGWAAHKFKEKFGDWPAWKWKEHVEKYGGVTPTPEVMRYVQSRMIAWRNSKRRKTA